MDEALRFIDEARTEGVRVMADTYPYAAEFSELADVLPDALSRRPDRVAYFKSRADREMLLAQLRDEYESRKMKWDWVMVGSSSDPEYWDYEGMTIKEIARRDDIEPEKFIIRILADSDFEVSAFFFSQNQNTVDRIIEQPFVMIGSASIADESRKPHPRTHGTFPKIFRRYVREQGRLNLGQVIEKMTSMPADYFGIPQRGKIKPGFFADLVLFDADEITDQATYSTPKNPPRHIRWVFVNGRAVVENGKYNGVKAGRFLTR